MSCGGEYCACGCEEFIELKPKPGSRVVEGAKDCGDGTCGCGCTDLSYKEFADNPST